MPDIIVINYSSCRVKKEFEEVNAASTGGAAAAHYEPSLGTITDEAVVAASKPLPDGGVGGNADAVVTPPGIQAAKIDNRRLSSSILMTDTDYDVENDDDYTPHFQRVTISGDDNTGVSPVFYSSAANFICHRYLSRKIGTTTYTEVILDTIISEKQKCQRQVEKNFFAVLSQYASTKLYGTVI